MEGKKPRGVLAGVLLAAAAAPACVPLPRYPSITPRSERAPVARLAERIDPWLLAEGLADRVAVEVDWVEGCEPAPATLEGLKKTLVTYGPPGRPVEIETGDEIARALWDALIAGGVDDPVRALVESHADPLRGEGVEHRYVLFAPVRGGTFGYSTTWWVEREGVLRGVRGVVVFRDAHARYDVLWVSLDEMERMTLVHEFGHQLGLVSDPRHERRHRHHRGHCTRLDCPMAHPTARLWWRNIWRGVFDVWFKDYCPECRAEIRLAQEEWRRQREADPDWEARVRRAREGELADAEARSRIQAHVEAEDWTAVLREAERPLADRPESRTLARYRIFALARLERADDALAALTGYPDADASAWAQVALIPARTLIAAGRHAEALSLLARVMDARGLAPRLDDYAYEQTSFVVREALTGMGRYRDAAWLTLTLAERPTAIAHSRSGTRAAAGDLFRRAGDLEQAEAILAPLHRSRRTRSWALDPLFRLRLAQGREAEARELLGQGLDEPIPHAITADEAENGRRARRLLVRATRLALLGRRDEAEADLDRAAALDERSRNPAGSVVWRAQIRAALGDEEGAVGLLRQQPQGTRLYLDLCGLEWTLPLRSDPDHDDLFGHCPAFEDPPASHASPR